MPDNLSGNARFRLLQYIDIQMLSGREGFVPAGWGRIVRSVEGRVLRGVVWRVRSAMERCYGGTPPTTLALARCSKQCPAAQNQHHPQQQGMVGALPYVHSAGRYRGGAEG